MKLLNKAWPLLILLLTVILYFKPLIFSGKVPIPADTIVGMYHPWRDQIWDNFTAGVPFKNFLITDPVRQQYPWRELAISLLKKGELPLWNPYSFSGTPLLANMQSAAFYPLNILFWFLPFTTAWSILIILEPILGGFFLYLYLRFFKIEKIASLIGSLSFAFSGFFVAWSEWGTILHVAIWLPLILLAKEKLLVKKTILWISLLVFAESSMVLAGHLQMSFYVFLVSTIYLVLRVINREISIASTTRKTIKIITRVVKILIPFVIFGSFSLLITLPQWRSTFQFISLSGRSFDQVNWQTPGWFIPWQHLIQFIAPDFFGNPTTLNYWGEWNYGEFAGYVGILPLIFAFFAIFFRRDKKTFFFSLLALFSLFFALPTPLAKIPYELKIPLLSTSQPTRLIFLVDFALAVLSALGLDSFLKLVREKKTSFIRFLTPFILVASVLIAILILTIIGNRVSSDETWLKNLPVAKRNLYLPLGLTLVSGITLFLFWFNQKIKNASFKTLLKNGLISVIILITIFDLLRFSSKFNSFSNINWLFPDTKIIEFIKNDPEIFRLMPLDRRIFPPNFPVAYRLQSIEGYDPLFIGRYGELIAAWARKKPDISPFSFNRIITPQDYESKFTDLLNVKYILSLKDEESDKLEKVFQEGETRLYRNNKVLPRVFFVKNIKSVKDKQEAIQALFDPAINLADTAIVEESVLQEVIEIGEAKIDLYKEQEVKIITNNPSLGFLILSDVYYPSWEAKIDGIPTKIYISDYTFRGIFVPKGKHEVVFKIRLL